MCLTIMSLSKEIELTNVEPATEVSEDDVYDVLANHRRRFALHLLNREADETVAIGEQLRLAEVSIRHGSPLAGRRLADSGIREETGAMVIGLWTGGEFHPAPSPDRRLPVGSVLLVSGRPD